MKTPMSARTGCGKSPGCTVSSPTTPMRTMGLAAGGVPMGTELAHFPPDAPQTVEYQSYPGVFVPPYHYPNPVTGKVWRA